MSINKDLPTSVERRHPYLRLVASNSDLAAPDNLSNDTSYTGSETQPILREMHRGFALAGMAIHVTPDSLRLQSELPAANNPPIVAKSKWLQRLRAWLTLLP